jgi:hypothetical protein
MTVKTVHRGLLITAVAGGLMLASQPLASAAIQHREGRSRRPRSRRRRYYRLRCGHRNGRCRRRYSRPRPPHRLAVHLKTSRTRPARPNHAGVIATRLPLPALPVPREQRLRAALHERSWADVGLPPGGSIVRHGRKARLREEKFRDVEGRDRPPRDVGAHRWHMAASWAQLWNRPTAGSMKTSEGSTGSRGGTAVPGTIGQRQ